MKIENLKIDINIKTMIAIDIIDEEYENCVLIPRDRREPIRTSVFFVEHRSYDESWKAKNKSIQQGSNHHRYFK